MCNCMLMYICNIMLFSMSWKKVTFRGSSVFWFLSISLLWSKDPRRKFPTLHLQNFRIVHYSLSSLPFWIYKILSRSSMLFSRSWFKRPVVFFIWKRKGKYVFLSTANNLLGQFYLSVENTQVPQHSCCRPSQQDINLIAHLSSHEYALPEM